MSEVNIITHFACPGCSQALAPASAGTVSCPRCSWTGQVHLFAPRAVSVNAGETALPDEATCLHHPRKKATVVCAGTGDYICSLCAVEIDGQTFGAEYLNAAGKDKAGKAFDRELARPDTRISLYIVLVLICPYVNVVMAALAFIWLPHAFYLYSKSRQLRKENPLYRRLVGTGRLVTLFIALILISVAWLVGVAAVGFALLNRHT